MTNSEKKKVLKQYMWLRISERELLEEIESIRSQYTGHAITYSDMPKAKDSEHDLSDYMVRVDDILQDLQSRQNEIFASYMKIDSAICKMPNMAEQMILRYRYLLGYDWEEIADRMGYALRHVYRLHGDALEHFEVG